MWKQYPSNMSWSLVGNMERPQQKRLVFATQGLRSQLGRLEGSGRSWRGGDLMARDRTTEDSLTHMSSGWCRLLGWTQLGLLVDYQMWPFHVAWTVSQHGSFKGECPKRTQPNRMTYLWPSLRAQRAAPHLCSLVTPAFSRRTVGSPLQGKNFSITW